MRCVVPGEDPRPGPGRVLATEMAAGVSFTDAQLRPPARVLPGRAEAPITPRYQLVERKPRSVA
jgi:hypothetical protein